MLFNWCLKGLSYQVSLCRELDQWSSKFKYTCLNAEFVMLSLIKKKQEKKSPANKQTKIEMACIGLLTVFCLRKLSITSAEYER